MATKAYLEGSGTEKACDDLFESIDDLLDFSGDDSELPTEDACKDEGTPSPIPAPVMVSAGIGGAGDHLSYPEDDDPEIANLEWLSNFFEDPEISFDFSFRSSSHVSVLISGAGVAGGGSGSDAYSSSSSSSCSSYSSGSGSVLIVPARARTKRPRPLSFSSRSFLPPPDSESVGESSPARKMKMKRKKKETAAVVGVEEIPTSATSASVRKCAHCEIQKTPQWRAGPMGPKTLCNACGVRYKSGRLFPEYRPAASPTFVPAIHSNSHKKVVEMRLRSREAAADDGGEKAVAARSCELMEYIRRGE
ncbi:GATA transcription factor 9 [Apostasia shenzhenica]|uniref:GATA transcription factor 9 n=1 Tax=Apostasia shenzhenica TaxID=1088818 RepID=A0A2I0AD14_9ASPA|nr:GATA transcription factor 9 [Apostasia shenzhenica]